MMEDVGGITEAEGVQEDYDVKEVGVNLVMLRILREATRCSGKIRGFRRTGSVQDG